jgi:tetratricopeptide (TPR) repeat protein
MCAERAKRLGRPKDVARAALIYGAELRPGQVDGNMVQLLEDALDGLPQGEDRLRARVLTRLGAALTPPASEEAFNRSSRLASEGLALARATGDAQTLLHALRFGSTAFGYVVDIHTRVAMVDEIMALARALGDELTEAYVGSFHVVHQFELGRAAQGRAAAERYCALIRRLPVPQIQWRRHVIAASLAGFAERFDEAYAHCEDLLRSATESDARPGLLSWAITHSSLALCTGSTTELARHEAQIMPMLQQMPLSPILACVHASLGRRDAARQALGHAVGLLRGFPFLLMGGQATVLLQDRALAEKFYPALCAERSVARFFWGPTGAFPLGPTSRVLGELALLLGLRDEARAHFDEALAHCKAAEAISFQRLCEEARSKLDTPSTAPKTAPAEPLAVSLVREGDVWVATSRGTVVRVKHSKGFDYLAALLESPGREHHVLVLAGAGEGPEDAGVVLDARARASYRARVEDLQERLAEAERNGDLGRADKAREELEALAEQLAGAVGLGGRDRKAGSNVERARINVQRRIKGAIRALAEHHPELGRYLDATVRTGTYCSFRPV